MPPTPAASTDTRDRVAEAAAALLSERGPSGFSLREAARRAGVSHAAPGYVFGDLRGLLTEVALRSNARLTARMERARRRHRADPLAAVLGVGRAYVRFAIEAPAEFRNLFGDHLDPDDPAVAAARLDGAMPLVEAVRALHPDADPGSDEFGGRMLLAWATVHGIAVLAVDGRLPGGPATTPPAVEEVLGQLVPALLAPLPVPDPHRGAPR